MKIVETHENGIELEDGTVARSLGDGRYLDGSEEEWGVIGTFALPYGELEEITDLMHSIERIAVDHFPEEDGAEAFAEQLSALMRFDAESAFPLL